MIRRKKTEAPAAKPRPLSALPSGVQRTLRATDAVCAACGSIETLEADPHYPQIMYCRRCTAQAATRPRDDELGTGD